MMSGTVLPEQRNIKLYYFVRCSGEFFVFVDDFLPLLCCYLLLRLCFNGSLLPISWSTTATYRAGCKTLN